MSRKSPYFFQRKNNKGLLCNKGGAFQLRPFHIFFHYVPKKISNESFSRQGLNAADAKSHCMRRAVVEHTVSSVSIKFQKTRIATAPVRPVVSYIMN